MLLGKSTMAGDSKVTILGQQQPAPSKRRNACKALTFSFFVIVGSCAYLLFTGFLRNQYDAISDATVIMRTSCEHYRDANASIQDLPPYLRCGMSVNVIGRLGNMMGQYATLYALSRANNQTPYVLPAMANHLRTYFHLSAATIEEDDFAFWNKRWSAVGLTDWMQPHYRELRAPFIYLTGYPNSWTFYHHLHKEIRREFQFNDVIVQRTQEKLRSYGKHRTSSTFVGIHVRRGDYVTLMNGVYRGVVAHSGFFVEAMEHFTSKYSDVVFVVVSDDIKWCQKNINSSRGNVFFEANEPYEDMALMAQCNHSIITIGTFGYWGAYLAGGETVYLSNYTLPDSPFLKVMHYDAFYLPEWIPIPADLSQFNDTSTQG